MLGKITVAILRFALSRASLSIQNRHQLLTLIQHKLVALPLHDIIKVNGEGQLLVKGRPVDIEEGRRLQESARGSLGNHAHQVVYEHVLFEAYSRAACNTENTVDLLFYRVAIWWGQEEERFLKLLAGGQERDLTP